MKKNVVAVGLGNPLMGDEGIGGLIISRFQAQADKYPSVDFIDAGTGGMSLLHIIAGRKKAVLIDCACMETEPGTIKRFTPADVKSVKKLQHQSLHEADVLKITELARRLGQLPQQVVILGIEPEKIEPGQKLSDTLSSKVDDYIATIAKELVQ